MFIVWQSTFRRIYVDRKTAVLWYTEKLNYKRTFGTFGAELFAAPKSTTARISCRLISTHENINDSVSGAIVLLIFSTSVRSQNENATCLRADDVCPNEYVKFYLYTKYVHRSSTPAHVVITDCCAFTEKLATNLMSCQETSWPMRNSPRRTIWKHSCTDYWVRKAADLTSYSERVGRGQTTTLVPPKFRAVIHCLYLFRLFENRLSNKNHVFNDVS